MSEQKKFTDEELDAIWKEMLKPEKSKPLTLEELRKMDGKPVFIVSKKDNSVTSWMLIDVKNKVLDGKWNFISFKDIGKKFDAYVYECSHIDRSAWEPCEECKTCTNCLSSLDGCLTDIYSPCFDCDDYSNFKPRNFCNECGRPLTDAAWNMLEKRLEKM